MKYSAHRIQSSRQDLFAIMVDVALLCVLSVPGDNEIVLESYMHFFTQLRKLYSYAQCQ